MKKYIIIGVSLILISVLFFISPQINNLINNKQSNTEIVEYSKNADTISKKDKNKYLKAASEYNENLIMGKNTSKEKYANILSFGNKIIGYIEIPKINIKLPIYHGHDESNLNKGVAHIYNSSFPIKGKTVHCVLSAHTALPLKELFDNIDELVIGDIFNITILNDKLTYKVTKTDIVLPEDVDKKLTIKDNQNLVTLMTCYPYSVNTHRFIATAKLLED